MSTRTFVNQLIGLAREYKKAVKRAQKRKNWPFPAFGHEISEFMIESGYFEKKDAKILGDAIEVVLQSSNPTYRYKP